MTTKESIASAYESLSSIFTYDDGELTSDQVGDLDHALDLIKRVKKELGI